MSGPEARLENNPSNLSPLEPKRASRRKRYQLRSLLWQASSLERVRSCGRLVVSNGVCLKYSDGVAGYAGLRSCGSVWACPVCSSRILWWRALEIGSTLGEALAQGHKLAFVTLTLRHNRKQSLGDLWSACSKSWNNVTSGNRWMKDQGRLGVVGWVRVWEVTHGRNGWHVHAHAVVVMGPDATSADVETLGSSMFERWANSAERSGLRRPLRRGQDWHLVGGDEAADELGGYLSKLQQFEPEAASAALGQELAYTAPGRARSSLQTRPVWSLLEDAYETGEIGWWRDWEAGSHGRRQVGWSKGLRDRFEVVATLTDDEIVAQDQGGDSLLMMHRSAWKELVSMPGAPLEVLEACERSGRLGATALLDSWGIEWFEPENGSLQDPSDSLAPQRSGAHGASAPSTAPHRTKEPLDPVASDPGAPIRQRRPYARRAPSVLEPGQLKS